MIERRREKKRERKNKKKKNTRKNIRKVKNNNNEKLKKNIRKKIKTKKIKFPIKLTNKDYEKIVKHYKYKVPKTKSGKTNNSKTRKLANKILATKLCKCIKKVQKTMKNGKESNAIGICKRSIFLNRGIKNFTFQCKGKNKLLTRKNNINNNKKVLEKLRNEINF